MWQALFDAVPRLGPVLLDRGDFKSPLSQCYEAGLEVVREALAAAPRELPVGDVRAQVWQMLGTVYVFDGYPPERVEAWRRMTGRDVTEILTAYAALGVLRLNEQAGTAELTERGRPALARQRGDVLPRDAVMQVRIALNDVERPQVWRRIQVPAAITLGGLHTVIQRAMGWEDYHLHSFTARGITYGEPDPELGFRDESAVTLGCVAAEGESLAYLYDFGDMWEHTLTIERCLEAEPDQAYPLCLYGQGACPLEDCGGGGGYRDLKSILADPQDDEHPSMLEWLGLESADSFDPARFDAPKANTRLHKAKPVPR